MDSIIRTFDIPTGRMIDLFRTSSVATSITFSPTNDFLATSHVDSVGVYLWSVGVRRLHSRPSSDKHLYRANRAQYSEVSFGSIVEDDVVDVSLPSMQGVAEEEGKSALT